jgi:hypothetical protein
MVAYTRKALGEAPASGGAPRDLGSRALRFFLAVLAIYNSVPCRMMFAKVK